MAAFAQCMSLFRSVYKYAELFKDGKVLTPLRAVGVAVESAHKFAREKGIVPVLNLARRFAYLVKL